MAPTVAKRPPATPDTTATRSAEAFQSPAMDGIRLDAVPVPSGRTKINSARNPARERAMLQASLATPHRLRT